MKLNVSATLLSLASIISSATVERRNCPISARFGAVGKFVIQASPGDTITIQVNMQCAAQFGITPFQLDYFLVSSDLDSNHQPIVPILLDRRAWTLGAVSDTLETQIPHAFFIEGAKYSVVVKTTSFTNGTDGSEVILQGTNAVPAAITINI